LPATPAPADEKFERWTAQRKGAVILEVLKGEVSVPEFCRRSGLTQNEYRQWAEEYHQGGVEALKVNKKGLEAEYRAEIKRRSRMHRLQRQPAQRRA
jgi:transposase-like protein